MADEVRLSYQSMADNCAKLNEYAEQFTEVSGNVSTLVGSFTGVWTGQAEATFEEDYATLTKSFTDAISVMQEITTMVQNYVNDMQEIENAYGSASHVSIG